MSAELSAQVLVALQTCASALKEQQDHHKRMALAIRQGPLVTSPMILSGGAGIIDDPAQLRANTGYYWGIRRLTLSGFTAGTAIVYVNGAGGEAVAPFAQAGTFTFGKGQVLLHPGDRLVVTATGITGEVQLSGAADIFESWYLPYYIA